MVENGSRLRGTEKEREREYASMREREKERVRGGVEEGGWAGRFVGQQYPTFNALVRRNEESPEGPGSSSFWGYFLYATQLKIIHPSHSPGSLSGRPEKGDLVRLLTLWVLTMNQSGVSPPTLDNEEPCWFTAYAGAGLLFAGQKEQV